MLVIYIGYIVSLRFHSHARGDFEPFPNQYVEDSSQVSGYAGSLPPQRVETAFVMFCLEWHLPYPHPTATHFASPRCTPSRPVVSTPRLSCIVYCIHEFPLNVFARSSSAFSLGLGAPLQPSVAARLLAGFSRKGLEVRAGLSPGIAAPRRTRYSATFGSTSSMRGGRSSNSSSGLKAGSGAHGGGTTMTLASGVQIGGAKEKHGGAISMLSLPPAGTLQALELPQAPQTFRIALRTRTRTGCGTLRSRQPASCRSAG